MREKILQLLTAKRLFFHKTEGIDVCSVTDSKQGLQLVKEILYETVDRHSALYLSGGSTPKPLYQLIAQEEKLTPGVVGLVDERYGDPMHESSNEKMIAQTGLVRYLSMRDIPYYTILHGIPIEKTAQRYDELYRSLNSTFHTSVGLFGIGNDGHTAGIASERINFHNRIFDSENRNEMVSWYEDVHGFFKKRVTMTFLGMTMLDYLLVLVFGDDKKSALERLFEQGREEDLPARFYKRKDISPKTLLITDQKV